MSLLDALLTGGVPASLVPYKDAASPHTMRTLRAVRRLTRHDIEEAKTQTP